MDAATSPEVDQAPASSAPTLPQGRARTALAAGIAVALSVVIVAPIVLSSSDLMRWAADPTGLGLSKAWPWLVFIGLDAAAATCVGMVVFAAWRGEPGGLFHLLTWLFAGGSAVANYRHGVTTPARDDEFFFPSMSLAGPLLLDVTLSRVRRWVRTEKGEQLAARPRFGMRWLPGVAFVETLRAWATAQREGIARPGDAIAFVRERDALAELAPVEQVLYAWSALGGADPYRARVWLHSRGVAVDQGALDQAAATLRTVEVLGVETAPAGLPLLDQAPAELPPAPEVAPEPGEPEPGSCDCGGDGDWHPVGSGGCVHAASRPAVAEPESAPFVPAAPTVPAELSDLSELSERSERSERPAPAEGEPSVEGLSKRAAIRVALEHLGGDDVPGAVAWLAARGVKVDKAEAYKVRRDRAEAAAASSRAQITAVKGGAR